MYLLTIFFLISLSIKSVKIIITTLKTKLDISKEIKSSACASKYITGANIDERSKKYLKLYENESLELTKVPNARIEWSPKKVTNIAYAWNKLSSLGI